MAAKVDALIQEASIALKTGRKADARRALDQAIALDERSEQAWLWMSGVVDSDEEQEICLENVLSINPTNQKAQKGVDAIRAKRSAAAAKPAVPFAGSETGRSSPAASPSTTGGTGSDWSSWPDVGAAPATSVEWGNPKPPATSDFPSQPSNEEYDSWMAGLSLGKGNTLGNATSGGGSSVPAFDLSDFDSAPFSSPGFESGPFSSPSYDPLPSSGSDGSAGLFSDTPAAPAQESDPFGLNKRSGQSPSASAASSQSSFSFKRKISEPPALAAARKQGDVAGTFDDYASSGESPIGAGPALTSPIPEPPSNAALFTTMDSSTSMANPSAYFAAIPEDIRASGTASSLLLVTLIALVILNVGSLAWLLGNLRVH
ncbi:MAG: tetratricopeptide repeat protein [Aggregatilineales bacterium]